MMVFVSIINKIHFSLDILGVQQSNFRRFDSVCSLDDCTDFESETITTNGDQLYFIHGKGNIAKDIQVQPFTLIRIQNPTEANQNRERRVYSPGVLFSEIYRNLFNFYWKECINLDNLLRT